MTIDPQTLVDRIEEGELAFFCANDQERIALFTALGDLGYRWNSGHELFEWYKTSRSPDDSVTFLICDVPDKRIVFGSDSGCHKTPVSDLATQKPAIDPSALLTMLGA